MRTQNTVTSDKINTIHPDPVLAAHGLSLNFLKRFFLKVERTECCWKWKGAIRDTGYARIDCAERRGGSIPAHKASFLIHNGPIPDGMEIMNACPNHCLSCVHPNHWTLGVHGDIKRLRNMQHTNTPLTATQMARAEVLCVQGGMTLAAIEALRTAEHITPPWMIELGFSVNFANRFFAKIHKTDHCWLWTACKNDDGYGYIGIGIGTETISAHKASYMLHKGPIPENMDILHNCAPLPDNPSCACPDHLGVGDASANAIDATEKHWKAKRRHWTTTCLTEESVLEIIKDCKSGKTRKETAEKFGISYSYVSHIVNGSRWTRLTRKPTG